MTAFGARDIGVQKDADVIKRQAQQIADLKRLLVTVRDDVMLRDGNPIHYADLLDEVERTLRSQEEGATSQRMRGA
jgi:hypothetical protein